MANKDAEGGEVERLAAEKEASEDRVFALTHRVATLEGRERDLNELIIGHRERVATLQAERDALGSELDNEREAATALRQRERDLSDELAEQLARATSLEAQQSRAAGDLEAERSRSEKFERRADELGQQLSGARDRIAALESGRDQLNDELERADRRSTELREREADLNERIGVHEGRIAALSGEVEQERRRAGQLEQRNAELASRLEGRTERIADLESGQDALRSELEEARNQVIALYERERDVQSRSVTLHEQVARLEVEGEMLNRALREERTAHSSLQQQEAALRPQLESARERIRTLETERQQLPEEDPEQQEREREREERERELHERVETLQEQIGRVKAHRETLERALTKEQGSRGKLKEQEAELAGARQQLTAMETERDRLTGELETERQGLAEVRKRESDLQSEIAQVREREGELQRDLAETSARTNDLQNTINSLREQASAVEAQRNTLLGERDALVAERDRLSARLEELESSRTYRLMRFTWRARQRARHPFRRRPRAALSRAEKRAKRKQLKELEKPAELEQPAEAPAPEPETETERPRVKPMATPAMRTTSRPAPAAPAETERPAEQPAPAPEKAAEQPAQQPEQPAAEPVRTAEPEKIPAPAPQPAVVADEIDLERERWLAKAQAPPADVTKLRVAGVLDEMSAACFGPDCDLMRIGSEDWAESLEAHEPHLLLVESAWQGNSGSWQYMVASYTHPDYIGLPNMRALIAACRERDIPTVFWNKEDPVHFERFKEAAALFDYVFTSDSNCIDRYAALEREGTGPISSLQFAAQPRIHNPVGAPAERDPSPVFAGAYYRDRHIDRQTSLQMLLDAAMPFGLQIYDRRFGSEDKAFGFPERFADRVKGALAYEDMIDAYKDHKVFLNVNSVTDSPTMFSRRVFELLACGTSVVSTESVGVQRTLGDVVSMIETEKEATEALTRLQDDAFWREYTRRGRRRVLSEHTYRHRLVELADTLGFNVTAYPGEEVAALALVDDVDQARRFRAVIASISAQETRPAELLIGSHTSVVGDLQELQSDGSEIRVRVVQQDPEATRAQRYRELAALAASPWLAILHPAHTYGEHHLTDLVLTTRYADADVIGSASFETSEGEGSIDRGLEQRFVDSVHPHSVLVKRDLVARRGWPDDIGASGSLSDWFRHGVRIYSADAGNFEADAALGLPSRAAATGSDRPSDG